VVLVVVMVMMVSCSEGCGDTRLGTRLGWLKKIDDVEYSWSLRGYLTK